MKYLRGSSIWVTRPPQSASWAWHGILRVRHLVVDLLRYNLGDGLNTSFFLDPWLGHPTLLLRDGHRRYRDLRCDPLCSVGNFIVGRRWNLPTPTTLDMHDLWPAISDTLLCLGDYHIIWILSGNGFSLRSAWEAIRPRKLVSPWTSLI